MSAGLSVHVSGLVHVYHADGHDVAALSGVDLEIAAGAALALLGPSGAGKSTLLTLIAGMAGPTAGTITIGDRRIDQLDDVALDALRGSRLSLVLQGGARNLLPHLSTRENVQLAQWGSSERDLPSVDDVLGMMRIDAGTAVRPAVELGGADAQRAALAVGIALRPGLLLADEPTASLGPDDSRSVVEALQRITREWGTTILMVTHDAAAAAAMERTVTIRDGRVGAQGREGLEVAMIAPDGSLPLPDDVLDRYPAGTLVQIQLTEPGHTITIDPWTPRAGDTAKDTR